MRSHRMSQMGFLALGLVLTLASASLVQAAGPRPEFEGAAIYAPTSDQLLDVEMLGPDSDLAIESKTELRHLSAAKYSLWITVGDNDGYGYGFNYPDGATLPFSNDPDFNWLFDNRTTAERNDTYARHTDYQSFSQSDFTLRFSFDPQMFTNVDTAWISIDVSGLQQNAWSNFGLGPTRLYLDGVEATGFAAIPNQGAWGSGVFTYGVSPALIADGILDARFDMQFIDVSPFFDPFSLDYVRVIVQGDLVPPAVPVLISPGDGSSTEAHYPAFNWQPSAGAVAYDLQVDDDPSFASPNVWQGWYEGTSYDSAYMPNGTYYWRVAAWGPTEDWSGWSQANKFAVDGPYRVPSEFPTIQSAISAIPIFRGGEVLVAPGTYTGTGNRNLSGFGDKSIQVRSESGPASTVIDCQNAGRAFYFDLYTGAGTVVNGFTIRNGTNGTFSSGAILCESAWPTIENCVIEQCTQGGIYATNGARPTVTNCNIRNNQWWGVRADNGGNVVIDECNFFQNQAYALSLSGTNGTTQVTNSTFSNSIGYEGEGTGVEIYNSSTPSFAHCTFQNNEGHGLYTWNSSVILNVCTFSSNGSQWDYGGGMYISGNSGSNLITVDDCTLESNQGYYGGGIYASGVDVDILGGLFDGNTAQYRGGAVYLSWSSTASAVGCTFVNNAADTGSAFYIESDASISKDRTGQTQALAGAGISRCLLAFATEGQAIYLESFAWIEIGCTDIYGNAGGDWTGSLASQLGLNGNISADPLFCNAANDDYQVTANSPVADVNNPCATIGAYDIGCGAMELSLSPTPLTFAAAADGPNPAAQNLQISNLGGSILYWTLTKKSGWLNVNLLAGVAPSSVLVSVDKGGLPGGIYYDTLVVVGDDAINSPQIVPVTLTLTAGEISVAPSLLNFESQYGANSSPDPQVLTISNSGSGMLSCQLSHGQSWLQLSESQFSVNPPRDVSVSVDPIGLLPGIYEDTIVIMSDDALNSPQYVGVTLTITDVDPPTLLVGSSSHPITGSDPLMIAVNVGDNLSITFTATTPLPGVVPLLGIFDPPSGSVFLPVSDGVSRFEWSPVPELGGTHYITVTADDDYQTTDLVVGITINSIPQFTSDFSDENLIEAEPLTFVVTATDNDAIQPTIDWNGVPSTATFDNGTPGTGTLRFTPDHNDVDATYQAEFTASDGIASVTESLVITVSNRQLTVQAMQPSPGAADDILVSDSIQIQFNEGIDQTTLSANLVFSSAKGTTLGYRYIADQRHLLIGAASGYLESEDTIGITLNPGLHDLAGYSLDQLYVETFATGTAVYPGDANDDGIVDERDVLPLGLFWGNTGPARNEIPDLNWAMAPGHIAFGGERWSPAGGAYADGDGSGVVDADDICGITENWSSSHTVSDNDKAPPDNLAASLATQDQTVLTALYEAVVTCPEGAGKTAMREMLQALLNSPATEAALPTDVELYQNYPNPFNPFTTIRFYLPSSGQVTLSIYNMLGQRVATLISATVKAGYSEADWDGADQGGSPVASGIYLYRLETSNFSETKRMLLLK